MRPQRRVLRHKFDSRRKRSQSFRDFADLNVSAAKQIKSLGIGLARALEPGKRLDRVGRAFQSQIYRAEQLVAGEIWVSCDVSSSRIFGLLKLLQIVLNQSL